MRSLGWGRDRPAAFVNAGHVRGRVSGRDLNPHGRDLRLCSPEEYEEEKPAGHRLAYVSEVGLEPIAYASALSAEFVLGSQQ